VTAIEALGVAIRKPNGTNGNGKHHEDRTEVPLTLESLRGGQGPERLDILRENHVQQVSTNGVGFAYVCERRWRAHGHESAPVVLRRRRRAARASQLGSAGSKPCALRPVAARDATSRTTGGSMLCEGRVGRAHALAATATRRSALPGASMWKRRVARAQIPAGALASSSCIEPDQGGRTVEAAVDEVCELRHRACVHPHAGGGRRTRTALHMASPRLGFVG
jgi:hypothetical protein